MSWEEKMVPWSVFELHWQVPPCVLLLCLGPSVGPPPGSPPHALPIPACKRKWFDCPKSPSGLVIPVDGVELAGSFVSELQEKLAGSVASPELETSLRKASFPPGSEHVCP